MTPYEFPICTMLTAQESNRNAQRVTSAGAENAEGRERPRPSAQVSDMCVSASHNHPGDSWQKTFSSIPSDELSLRENATSRTLDERFGAHISDQVSPAAQTAADAGDAHAMPESRPAAQSASPDFYTPERRIRDRQLADHLQFMEGA